MIYVFGDSFSQPFSKETDYSYVTHKGYNPKQYYDYFRKELGMKCVNKSRGGLSNDFIFNLFMNEYKNIMNGDMVIFGWTDVTRFEFVDTENNRWMSSLWKYQDILSQNTVNELRVNRTHPLYIKQFCDRITFINHILKGKKVIHWSWINHEYDYSIEAETNGLIKDNHYGEYGHKEVYKILSDGIKDKDMFIYNIPICDRTMI